jgi:hypothetical protein
MKLLFSTGKGIVASAIRAFTWSQWSHVDLVAPDETTVIGAIPGRGVEHVTIASRLAESRRAAVMHINDADNSDGLCAWRFAQLQIGKRYDLAAVFGLALHRYWTDPGKWFCSELVATAMDWELCCPYDKHFTRRITPQDLWVLNYPKFPLDLASFDD